MRPAGLRLGAAIKKNGKYFVHGFPPFRGGCGLLRLRGFFLRGKCCGFCRFLPLDGIAGEQAAIDRETKKKLQEKAQEEKMQNLPGDTKKKKYIAK